jgi:septum formation protein
MLVLASQSPRRAELLRQAGISFEVRVANIDENRMPGESPADYVRRLALAKARAVARDGETVLGADTVVVAGGAVLGKPADAAEARRMLELLSGRAHQVLTGIAIVRDGQTIADCASTSVWFSPLRPEEIDAYVASGEPMDKAGGYAIQGLACRFVERIEGCYFNVVGLPVSLVYRHLAM